MKKTYRVDGMHCKACELLVKKGSSSCDAFSVSKANHRTGEIEVDWKGDEKIEKLDNLLDDLGYSLSDGSDEGKKKGFIQERVALLLVAVVLAYTLIETDVIGLMSTVQQGTSLGIIFVLGLVASVSTCLAVTGGVIIGFTELVDKSKTARGHVKLHATFQAGRVIGFFVLGALLGIIGQTVSVSLGFASWMNAIIAVVFVYLGLQLLGFVPSLSSLGVGLPDKRSHKILSQKNPIFAPVVGALTFFLPCGFTQSVQLMALASGSRLTGGLMMMTFALGTLPGLSLLGMGTSFAKDQRKYGFEQIVAMILVVFGLFTFWGSASIWGWTDALASSGSAPVVAEQDEAEIKPAVQEVQKISLGHDGLQLVPETTTLVAGNSYEITILPESDGLGCMSTVTLPRLDTRVIPVKQGEPIVYTLENVQAGQYSFVCGAMGMQQGKLIIQ